MANLRKKIRHYFGSIFARSVRIGDDANTAMVLGVHDNNDENERVALEPANRRLLKLGGDQNDRVLDSRYYVLRSE